MWFLSICLVTANQHEIALRGCLYFSIKHFHSDQGGAFQDIRGPLCRSEWSDKYERISTYQTPI